MRFLRLTVNNYLKMKSIEIRRMFDDNLLSGYKTTI